nr:hypothetical protein [Xenococcaceae cyanobacterium MO_188.B29]
MSTNSQLQRRAHDVITKAKDDYAKRLEPVSALMEQMFSLEEKVSEAEQLYQFLKVMRDLVELGKGKGVKGKVSRFF